MIKRKEYINILPDLKKSVTLIIVDEYGLILLFEAG